MSCQKKNLKLDKFGNPLITLEVVFYIISHNDDFPPTITPLGIFSQKPYSLQFQQLDSTPLEYLLDQCLVNTRHYFAGEYFRYSLIKLKLFFVKSSKFSMLTQCKRNKKNSS